ncbi:MAG: multicopper oxidase domain-containing protein [Candidatus Thermoplasmatota archaeon]|nr:multicopper oxidase domain-containing protein [Candidatus Thermoplasmatota archaeon]
MPKSPEKKVKITRRDIYELKLGDRDPIQLSEDEAGELYEQLRSEFAPSQEEGAMQTPPTEHPVAVVAAPEEEHRTQTERPRDIRPKVVSPEKRRKQTVIMAGIVIIVLGLAFAGYDFSALHPAHPAVKLPPPAPYVHLYVTAGVGGGLNFNGTSPGPTLKVPLNDWVWLSFTVASDAGVQHSWVLVPSNVSKVSAPDYTPVFPNATTPNPTAGDAIGSTVNVVFKATKAGSYLYICEVPGHFEAGMYGSFIVGSGNVTNTTSTVRSVNYSLVAGQNGKPNFNGTVPGPSFSVVNGTRVHLKFTVSNTSPTNHSWVLVPGNVSNTTTPDYPPVFTNASSPNPTNGTKPGVTVEINFTANRTGSYKYISEVNNDFKSGMWGWFNVTAANSSTPAASHSAGTQSKPDTAQTNSSVRSLSAVVSTDSTRSTFELMYVPQRATALPEDESR